MSSMGNAIKQKYLNTVWGYNPQEFFPILYQGKLQNKGEFVAYKFKSLVRGRAW